MFCKAIHTMRRPLFSFKYVLQGNLYNAATAVQFKVCFARQSIQCGDLCPVSSMFCKAIYTMRRPLISFKYILQGNIYTVATFVQFQVCFARQSIQCGDLCSVSSMCCKAIYTIWRLCSVSNMFCKAIYTM